MRTTENTRSTAGVLCDMIRRINTDRLHLMSITVITDCADDNAAGRIAARTGMLTGMPVQIVRVAAGTDATAAAHQAAGNLVDQLDAYRGGDGIIMVNVAPRGDEVRTQRENGTPFGFFWYGRTLVVSTIDGGTLSLAAHYRVMDELQVLDIAESAPLLLEADMIDERHAQRMQRSQFRSFDFQPFAAAALWRSLPLASSPQDLSSVPDVDTRIWWIDNFGNAKVTRTAEELMQGQADSISTVYGDLRYTPRLADVPEGETMFVSGSSGIGDHRLLEIVRAGESAAAHLGCSVGDRVLADA